MYKMILVDNNKIIRNAIADIIDWNSLGFEIVAKINDGREVVQYLKKNPVDVILSDIKIPYMSGVDLARYLYENQINVKIVLMGDFNNYETIKNAIHYQVQYCLLKPLNLDELLETFKRLHEKMEKEKEELKTINSEKAKNKILISLLEEQFSKDIITGEIINEEEIIHRIQFLNLNIDIEKSRCSIIGMKLKLNGQAQINGIPSTFSHNNYNIFLILRELLSKEYDNTADNFKFYPVNYMDGKFKIFAVGKPTTDKYNENEIQIIIRQFLQNATQNINLLTGLDFSIEYINNYGNLIECATGNKEHPPAQSGNSGRNTNSSNSSPLIMKLPPEEEKKLLLLVRKINKTIANLVKDEDPDGLKSYLYEIMNETKKLEMPYVKKICAIILLFFDNLLSDNEKNDDIFLLSDFNLGHNRIIQFADFQDVKGWFDDIIEELTCYFNNIRCNERAIIKRIKQIIDDNIQNNITLEFVASQVYLNPVYLSRLFKQETGETFTEYIMRKRIEKAIYLLHNSNLKVYEISQEVGYKNIKYFYKIFKKYTGMTTLEHREGIQ